METRKQKPRRAGRGFALSAFWKVDAFPLYRIGLEVANACLPICVLPPIEPGLSSFQLWEGLPS
jgi:hypothetical protein